MPPVGAPAAFVLETLDGFRNRLFGRRKDDGVDDVDDAIGADDIGFHDLGISDGDAAFGGDGGFGSVDRLDFTGFDVSGHYLAGNHMIGKDGGEFGLVFGLEQAFHGAGGEFRKGSIGRGEHGEGARLRQGGDEVGGDDRLDETRGDFHVTR